MKKILSLLILLTLYLITLGGAHAIDAPTGVTFIYINGSNNLAYNNRLKFKTAFIEDVNKMHPQIKKQFEENELIIKQFLGNGKYVINETPIPFYWGDKSLSRVETLDRDLKSAKKYSPKIAHQARSIFAHCLHDAVWVQKNQNMIAVLKDLHKVVQTEVSKGNKVVLLGYSAGSFITYQYYMTKATTLIPTEIAKGKYSEEIEEFIANTPVKPTCFDALVAADLIRYSDETGKYIPNQNIDAFKQNYTKLDEYTKSVCFANGTVKGVIGFASPARLFYSDLLDDQTSINYISRLMAKSIIENNVFYLTVNYSNDPFGFSNADNFTLKGLQNNNQDITYNANLGQGFIYNKSNNYVPRTFITAHLAYWQTPKRFAKAIVKTFNEGYANFYGAQK